MDEMSQPLRVYIVEDSPIIQRALASLVVEAGAKVSGYSGDARTAIADVLALEPDLILIDIRLESGSGFDVLRALQAHGNLAPAALKVVLTNYANAEYRTLCTRLGADRFFDKSLEMSEATALIRALASGRGASPSGSAVPLTA